MFLVVYVKYEFREDVSNVNTGLIPKGFKNVIGNKGGISIHFILKNRSFNFIATHLRHGQNNQDKRDQMASELVSEFKMAAIQKVIPDLEADQFSDFCIFMGDMNYRMNTTFAEFNNSNVATDAVGMIPTHD